MGRLQEPVRLWGLLRAVFVHALRHGGLRYRVLRLCAALPLEFLSPLFPELKGVVGPHMFGYNKRTHLIHFAIYLPASAAAAALCTLLCT